MSEELEYDLSGEINNLCQAYSTLVEIDTGLLDKRDGAKLKKAKDRLLETIVDYILALPPIEDEKES